MMMMEVEGGGEPGQQPLQMQQVMSIPIVESVSLGDLMQKISHSIYSDLHQLLASMPSYDPELRTTNLLYFIHRSRKKLCQILALIRWLSQPQVNRLFQSLDDFFQKVYDLELNMTRFVDEMYFVHANIFSLRSPKYETELAHSILATRRYPALPAAIATCGMPVYPKATIDINTLQKDLELLIKAKLLFKENPLVNLGADITISVKGGVVKLSNQHLYDLYLTLQHRNVDAPWKALSFTIRKGLSEDFQVRSISTKDNAKYNREKELIHDFTRRPPVTLVQAHARALHTAYCHILLEYHDVLQELVSKKLLSFHVELQKLSMIDKTGYTVGLWKSEFHR